MQSLILTVDGLKLADTPIPPVMPGDVRIEVRAVGICGTDLALWKGEMETKLPIVLGHEIAGVIHESSLPEMEPGTLVTMEVDVFCGRCWYCQNGQRDHCITRETLGITTDGGLSEFLSVPGDLVHPLPEGVSAIAGTFTEPLASAIETRRKSPAKKDEVVVIIGSGKLGLLIAQVYDASGADVFVVGRNRWQLGLARQLGMRNTINANDKDWKKKILDATFGVGPRIVVEATGNTDGIRMALEIVRSRGEVALKSMHGRPYPIQPTDLVNRELHIHGTSRGPFLQALDMLEKGRIEVNRLVSKEFSLEEGSKAFEHADQPAVTKVIVNI